MWSRRGVLAGAGASLFSVTVAGKLRNASPDRGNRYVQSVSVEEQRVDVDDDDRYERLVRVRFVPTSRLVAVRLEHRVAEASNLELADTLDYDRDGWYAVARRTGFDARRRGTERFLHAPQSRRVPGLDDRWIAEFRGYQSGATNRADFRGFHEGDTLRLVAVPYDHDDVVVTEHVVGSSAVGR
jgi:hypothetical protein